MLVLEAQENNITLMEITTTGAEEAEVRRITQMPETEVLVAEAAVEQRLLVLEEQEEDQQSTLEAMEVTLALTEEMGVQTRVVAAVVAKTRVTVVLELFK
tara:strand:- start:94 stop:393 length:300 start_codon:yes stop_codon:yes gene_type:complete